jgi:hypothetical protein
VCVCNSNGNDIETKRNKEKERGGTWLSGSGIEKKQNNSLRNFCWREPTTPTTSIKLKFIEKKKNHFQSRERRRAGQQRSGLFLFVFQANNFFIQ